MHSVHCTLRMGLASGLGRAASLGVREVNNKSLPDAEWGGLHLASKIKRTEHKAEIVFSNHCKTPFPLSFSVGFLGGWSFSYHWIFKKQRARRWKGKKEHVLELVITLIDSSQGGCGGSLKCQNRRKTEALSVFEVSRVEQTLGGIPPETGSKGKQWDTSKI